MLKNIASALMSAISPDRRAEYKWEMRTPDGVIIAVESPPGMDDTPFASVGFIFRARTAIIPDDIHTFVSERTDTVIVTARSSRESVLPHIDLTIEPGMALVWSHRAVKPFQIMGNASVDPFETMLYGREHVTGLIEIAQVWPNGQVIPFDSYETAMQAL